MTKEEQVLFDKLICLRQAAEFQRNRHSSPHYKWEHWETTRMAIDKAITYAFDIRGPVDSADVIAIEFRLKEHEK